MRNPLWAYSTCTRTNRSEWKTLNRFNWIELFPTNDPWKVLRCSGNTGSSRRLIQGFRRRTPLSRRKIRFWSNLTCFVIPRLWSQESWLAWKSSVDELRQSIASESIPDGGPPASAYPGPLRPDESVLNREDVNAGIYSPNKREKKAFDLNHERHSAEPIKSRPVEARFLEIYHNEWLFTNAQSDGRDSNVQSLEDALAHRVGDHDRFPGTRRTKTPFIRSSIGRYL